MNSQREAFESTKALTTNVGICPFCRKNNNYVEEMGPSTCAVVCDCGAYGPDCQPENDADLEYEDQHGLQYGHAAAVRAWQAATDSHPPKPTGGSVPQAWIDAMQEFVDRVEKGEVRSSYTYNKFKDLLATQQPPAPNECECCGYPGHDLPKWRKVLRDARPPTSNSTSGWRNSVTGEYWPDIGEHYLICIGPDLTLQNEVYEFDQGDDGMGGGEYFWSRDDIDECPAFNPERDLWIALEDVKALLTTQQQDKD